VVYPWSKGVLMHAVWSARMLGEEYHSSRRNIRMRSTVKMLHSVSS